VQGGNSGQSRGTKGVYLWPPGSRTTDKGNRAIVSDIVEEAAGLASEGFLLGQVGSEHPHLHVGIMCGHEAAEGGRTPHLSDLGSCPDVGYDILDFGHRVRGPVLINALLREDLFEPHELPFPTGQCGTAGFEGGRRLFLGPCGVTMWIPHE